jgi:hypothetical protein
METWATFSVVDHRKPIYRQALALFDRIVVPLPPTPIGNQTLLADCKSYLVESPTVLSFRVISSFYIANSPRRCLIFPGSLLVKPPIV